MLQTNEDRYDCLLILRLIDIHTVPVMDGEQYLADVFYRVSVPVLLTGGIQKPEDAEHLLDEGKADLIGVGRALFRDAHWAERA